MITIPKKVEYSIILISYLAKNNGETVSLADVSKRLLLPYRFLGQLAMNLRVAGIIESKEGKKTLYDLLESLDENKHLVTCMSGDKVCAREAKCDMRKVWNKLENSFVKELRLIKLAEL
jgi:Rrf2 family protein